MIRQKQGLAYPNQNNRRTKNLRQDPNKEEDDDDTNNNFKLSNTFL